MTIDLAAAKAHLNITTSDDDTLITRLVAVASAQLGRMLGFAIDDATEFPDGTPEDLQQAQLLLIGHYYENREATAVGVSVLPIPLGVVEIVREYRTFTFEDAT